MSEQSAPSQVNELKVSGHMMGLEPGLYCVFSAPGSAPPAADTGLPIVRVSAGPGVGAGRVEVTGLSSEGWIGPSAAALVRVSDGRADLLVTVYQAAGAATDAPQLQVLRLTDSAHGTAAGSPARAQMAAPAGPGGPVQVMAHIYGRGDVGGTIGEWMGEPGSNRWIEGFGLAPIEGIPSSDVEYQAVLGRGWLSPWSEGGQFCGSRGMSLPILGLRIRLKGGSAGTKRLRLSATFVDGSKVGPVGDGEPCEAESLAALEAFKLEVDDGEGAGLVKRPAGKGAKVPPVKAASAKPSPAKPKAAVAPAPEPAPVAVARPGRAAKTRR